MAKEKKDGVIKVSIDVLKVLQHKRKRKPVLESYDALLRRILNLPNRDGTLNSTKEFYLLTKPNYQVFTNYSEATGQAILNAVKLKQRQAEKPIEVREVP